MKKALPIVLLSTLPFPSWAQTPDQAPTIVVTGAGLDLPPGTPAYGSVVIGRERLMDSASGRIENILGDVAGFQQFRRSDSRSANPSSQGVTLRALGGNASSRRDVLAASETMHHQRCGQWGSVGQIQTSAQVTAVMAFEGESFGPHAKSFGVAAKMTLHPRPDNRLATCVTGV